jgi:hypothetical protein
MWVVSKSFKAAALFKCLKTTVTDEGYICENIKNISVWEMVVTVQFIFILSESIKTKFYLSCVGVRLKGRT